MRTSKIAVLFAVCLASAAVAQPTEWWTQAFPQMTEQNRASTWKAESGDTLSKIVNQTYKVPLNKMTTLNRVIDAIIAYNNALAGSQGKDVTLIKNRDLIFTGNKYFLPDPASINEILNGKDPAQIVAESLRNPANKAHAEGAGTDTPSHGGTGDIEVAGADGDVAPPPGGNTPPPPPGGGTTTTGGDQQALGDWGARDGRVAVIGVVSAEGPQVPAGSSPTTPETPEELRSNGGSEGTWMLSTMQATYNARAYGIVTDGALRAGVDAGLTNR